MVRYETAVCTETKTVPYQKAVVRYDHCGWSYPHIEMSYKDVTVTVTTKVPLVKYVKVCD